MERKCGKVFAELLMELKRPFIQVILSVVFLIMNIEVITWIVLAFWGIRLAIHVLKKDAERRCLW
jgi:hypothetical protein